MLDCSFGTVKVHSWLIVRNSAKYCAYNHIYDKCWTGCSKFDDMKWLSLLLAHLGEDWLHIITLTIRDKVEDL